jgi:hypothetical protein
MAKRPQSRTVVSNVAPAESALDVVATPRDVTIDQGAAGMPVAEAGTPMPTAPALGLGQNEQRLAAAFSGLSKSVQNYGVAAAKRDTAQEEADIKQAYNELRAVNKTLSEAVDDGDILFIENPASQKGLARADAAIKIQRLGQLWDSEKHKLRDEDPRLKTMKGSMEWLQEELSKLKWTAGEGGSADFDIALNKYSSKLYESFGNDQANYISTETQNLAFTGIQAEINMGIRDLVSIKNPNESKEERNSRIVFGIKQIVEEIGDQYVGPWEGSISRKSANRIIGNTLIDGMINNAPAAPFIKQAFELAEIGPANQKGKRPRLADEPSIVNAYADSIPQIERNITFTDTRTQAQQTTLTGRALDESVQSTIVNSPNLVGVDPTSVLTNSDDILGSAVKRLRDVIPNFDEDYELIRSPKGEEGVYVLRNKQLWSQGKPGSDYTLNLKNVQKSINLTMYKNKFNQLMQEEDMTEANAMAMAAAELNFIPDETSTMLKEYGNPSSWVQDAEEIRKGIADQVGAEVPTTHEQKFVQAFETYLAFVEVDKDQLLSKVVGSENLEIYRQAEYLQKYKGAADGSEVYRAVVGALARAGDQVSVKNISEELDRQYPEEAHELGVDARQYNMVKKFTLNNMFFGQTNVKEAVKDAIQFVKTNSIVIDGEFILRHDLGNFGSYSNQDKLQYAKRLIEFSADQISKGIMPEKLDLSVEQNRELYERLQTLVANNKLIGDDIMKVKFSHSPGSDGQQWDLMVNNYIRESLSYEEISMLYRESMPDSWGKPLYYDDLSAVSGVDLEDAMRAGQISRAAMTEQEKIRQRALKQQEETGVAPEGLYQRADTYYFDTGRAGARK